MRIRIVALGLVWLSASGCLHTIFDPPAEDALALKPDVLGVETDDLDGQAPSATLQVRFLRGGRYLGTCVEEPSGAALGVVRDVYLDAKSGEIMWVEVNLEEPAGELVRRFVQFDALSWNDDPASPAAALIEIEDASLPKGAQDVSTLFEGQLIASVSGIITAVEPVGRSGQVAIVKVQDEDNRLHRVLVEPARVAQRRLPWLIEGKQLRVEGVETRDGTGRLVIARVLHQASDTLYLRGKYGAIQWDALAREFQSATALEEESIRAVDGTTYPITGWVVDVDLELVGFVCLDVAGVERALPWEELILRAEGGWRVAHDERSIGILPRVPEPLDGLVEL